MPQEFADITALRTVIEQTLCVVNGHQDPEAAYVAATAVGRLGQDLVEAAAVARGRALSRVSERENLPISQLAERMGLSKSRCQQLMHIGRTPR